MCCTQRPLRPTPPCQPWKWLRATSKLAQLRVGESWQSCVRWFACARAWARACVRTRASVLAVGVMISSSARHGLRDPACVQEGAPHCVCSVHECACAGASLCTSACLLVRACALRLLVALGSRGNDSASDLDPGGSSGVAPPRQGQPGEQGRVGPARLALTGTRATVSTTTGPPRSPGRPAGGHGLSESESGCHGPCGMGRSLHLESSHPG